MPNLKLVPFAIMIFSMIQTSCSIEPKESTRISIFNEIAQVDENSGDAKPEPQPGPDNVGTPPDGNSGIPSPVNPPLVDPNDPNTKADKRITIEQNENAVVKELSLVQQKGSHKRFLGTKALTQIYSRVFIQTNGKWNYYCRFFKSHCKENMFNTAESNAMGDFDFDRNFSNLTPVRAFKLEYIRSLRGALQRECRVLVEAEWDAEDLTKNKVVRNKTSIEAATIDGFMKTLLGVPPGFDLNFPAETYATEINALNKDKTVEENALELKDNFIYLCILLGSDPLVIMY